jgi:hypothetical protein
MAIARSDAVWWWEPKSGGNVADKVSGATLTLNNGAAWDLAEAGIGIDGVDQYLSTPTVRFSDYNSSGFTLLVIAEFRAQPDWALGITGPGTTGLNYVATGRTGFLWDAFGGGLNVNSASTSASFPASAETNLYCFGFRHDTTNIEGFTLRDDTTAGNVATASTAYSLSGATGNETVIVGARRTSSDYSNMAIRRVVLLNREATNAELVALINGGDPLSWYDIPGLSHRSRPWVVSPGWGDIVAGAETENKHIAMIGWESHAGGTVKHDDTSFHPMFSDALRKALSGVGLAGVGLTYPKSVPVANQTDTTPFPMTELDFTGWSGINGDDRAAAFLSGGYGAPLSARAFLQDTSAGTLGYWFDDGDQQDDFEDLGLTPPWEYPKVDTTLTSARVHVLENGSGSGTLDGMGYDTAWRIRSAGELTMTGSQQDDPVVAAFDLTAGDIGFGIARGGATNTNAIVCALSAKGSKWCRVGVYAVGGLDPVDDYVAPHFNTVAKIVANEEIDVLLLPVAVTNAASAGRDVDVWWAHWREYAEALIDNCNNNTTGNPPLVVLVCIYLSGGSPNTQEAYYDRAYQWAADQGYDIWNLSGTFPSNAELDDYYDDDVHLSINGFGPLVDELGSRLGLARGGLRSRARKTRSR